MSTYGHFSADGSEYVINNPATKRFQMNYLWNKRFLVAVNQFGAGSGAYQNNATFYIAPNGRGAVLRNGNRFLYVRDLKKGTVWNPGWYPSKVDVDDYQCTHGQAYTEIKSRKDGVLACWTLFVGTEAPAECWIISLKNETDEVRKLKVYPFVEFALDGYPANSGWHSWVQAYHFEKNNLLFAKNSAEERPHPWYNGFMATDAEISGFDTSKDHFLGTYGDISYPDAFKIGMGNTEAACEDMVAAYEIPIELHPGEEKIMHLVVGMADSIDTAISVASELLKTGKMEQELEAVNMGKVRDLELAAVTTPDEIINYFANFWLKKQTRLCAEIGRGAGKGFRDQLQDAWAIAAFQPDMAKEKIKEALEQIYHTGRCVRGWSPLKDRNCSDGPTWVAPTINAYLKETGDYDFLYEHVKYLDEGEDTVWEHILTTVRYSSDDVGEHGLVHIHVGDWNDSLNGMGRKGIGESVWTSIALYNALQATIEIAVNIVKDTRIVAEMQERATRIKHAVNETAWDGQWYIAGYNDDLMKVGSFQNDEGMIYLNPQVWAVMTGIAEGERKTQCLKSVEKYLESKYGALTLAPAYTKYRSDIGRLTGFVPGIWENGTPYCHGGAFKVVMECLDGRSDKAYESLLKILPDSKDNPVEHSGAEPYALTNMYFGPDNPRAGQTQFSWITGTAGWIYRAITQYMLGFYPGYNEIILQPAMPSVWKKAHMVRKYRECSYDIEIYNKYGNSIPSHISVDGKQIEGNCIPIFTDGEKHQIIIEI